MCMAMKSVKRDDDARFHLNGHDDVIACKTQLHNKLPEIISGNKVVDEMHLSM